ncbi:MAG TPA: hypothetical protein VJP78_10900, partial [Thermoleophilia bacterium]|nr:hypothetical protein [Thermoleophilia bacterium]
MHANPSKTVALIVVALVVALPGLIGGCGAGSDESTSTTVTSVPASTTLTTAASTTTTAATTTTTVAPTTTSIAATTTTRPTGLPTLAEVEGYRQWLKMNVEPIQGRTHGLTDIYINQDRETIAPNGTLTFPFPDG